MDSKRTFVALLAGSMIVSGLGLAGAPPAGAASRATTAVALPAVSLARPAAAPKAALAVAPSTTNRGGIVDVSGAGFAPREIVVVTLKGVRAAVARADRNGLLPATGISVPYALTPGSYTVAATGVTSKRTATATVTVQQLTPTIAISASSATPGAREIVRGAGFGRRERVTLSLNGAALETLPAVITTTNGAFTATFVVPRILLQGSNTVSAIGNRSRINALTGLTGTLVRRTQFYMAGGVNNGAETSEVAVLNTNRQPATVRLTLYFDNGAQVDSGVLVAQPLSTLRVPVVSLAGAPVGAFGVAVNADRQVAAELVVSRNGQDGDTIPGSNGLSARWYLAAGSTNGGAETVSILNPDATRVANVQLQFLTQGGAPKTVTVAVPAHTNYVANINALAPNADVSVVATSDMPVLVERSQTFGTAGAGLTTRAGAPTAATEWLFAAGTTANGVQTIYTVLNPGDFPAQVSASFYAVNGAPLGSTTVSVAPRSRATINLGSVAQGDRIAAVVTSNQAVVVEREEYTGSFASARSGSVVFGQNGAGLRWTFPGGDTSPGVNEALVLFNPSAAPVVVTATFYNSTGAAVRRQYTIAPTAHTEIPVNALGLTAQHGAVLQSSGGGFIAEQGITTTDARLFRSTQGLAQ